MVVVLNAVEVCVLWKVMFGQSHLLDEWHSELIGSCIKTYINLRQNCCSAKQMPCNLVHSGHDSLGSCACLLSFHLLLYEPVMMLCALVHADSDVLRSYTCWP